MFLIRVVAVVAVLLTFGQACAQDDLGCGTVVDDVEGGCLLFAPFAGGHYLLDNYEAYEPGDTVYVTGRLGTIVDPCQPCGTWYYPCVFETVFSECPNEYSCCSGRVGDANGSGAEIPTIGDISVMIAAKFITGACIASGPNANIRCLAEADMNQSGGCNPTCDDITITDISMLIDFSFISYCGWGVPPYCHNLCLTCP